MNVNVNVYVYERFATGWILAAVTAALLLSVPLSAQPAAVAPLLERVDAAAAALEGDVIAWRRDIHEHPELSNRETRTAALVADHLRSLEIPVETGVAHTGVVGLLEGGRPGPVIALRADMDALPVAEQVDLPFASKATAVYNGEEVGVMHACGHDAHVAMLMGVVEILAGMREELPGTVKLIFQPAEEGPPAGERGGASLMVAEGVLADPRPEAIFGLHVTPEYEVGEVATRPRGLLAAADWLEIRVTGAQSHGATPWRGVDPIVVAAQIVGALQAIPARQLDVTLAPAVVTIGSIHGGVRGNIIPTEVEMVGTVRTFDAEMQEDLHRRIERTATHIAEAAGATAEVTIERAAPVTWNDPELVAAMRPALERAVGAESALTSVPYTWAEDFSEYQKVVPGMFFLLGIRTPGAPPEEFPSNHSPHFRLDEDALVVGVRTMARLALEALAEL